MNTITVYQYIDYREYIKAYFNNRKKDDPKFSHRYLCRRLGLTSPNFMMMVMQGKRNLTRALAFKLSQELKLGRKEAEYFECMVGFNQAETHHEKELYFSRMREFRRISEFVTIEEHQYDYYSNWYNLVIRELVTHPDFKENFKWLAGKIQPRITEAKARHSIALLLKLGMIRKDGNRYVQTDALISTGPQVVSTALVNFHRTMAQRAIEALDCISRGERDITACTVNLSMEGFRKVEKTIADCRRKVMQIAESETEVDRVYQVNFHLFPVSQPVSKKTKRSNDELQ